MNRIVYILIILPVFLLAQEQKKEEKVRLQPTTKEERNLVRKGNDLYEKKNFVDAEVQYKKAIATNPNYPRANYNLGNAVYEQNRFKEAIPSYELAAKTSEDKTLKAQAFHNAGNAYFAEKDYTNAVEAYKNSLRQDPKDEETRYNLALAQKMLEQQQNQDDQNKDKDQDQEEKQDQNKDQQKDQQKDQDENQDQNGENEDQNQDQQDQPNQPQENDKKDPPQQPKPNQLSKQQMEQLLEAMNNEENKTQKKVNAKEARGQKVKKEKDW